MRVIVNELAPDRMRGLFGCFVQMNIALGICVVYSFSLGFPDLEVNGPKEVSRSFLWRFAIAVPTILAIIQVALLSFVFHYESPQYYISVKKV